MLQGDLRKVAPVPVPVPVLSHDVQRVRRGSSSLRAHNLSAMTERTQPGEPFEGPPNEIFPGHLQDSEPSAQSRKGLRASWDSGGLAAVATLIGGGVAASAAIVAAGVGTIGVIVAAASSNVVAVENLRKEISAGNEASKIAYTRGIGTTAYTNYVGVLIEAENLFTRARAAVAAGVTSGNAGQLHTDIEAMEVKIKATKSPVDLVATGELREMADLTIDLYGENAGGLKAKLSVVRDDEDLKDPAAVSIPDPDFDFGGTWIKHPGAESGRLDCAEEAGRVIFTEAAQHLLQLGVPQPDFTNDCYRDWLTDESKWHPDVPRDSATPTPTASPTVTAP